MGKRHGDCRLWWVEDVQSLYMLFSIFDRAIFYSELIQILYGKYQ